MFKHKYKAAAAMTGLSIMLAAMPVSAAGDSYRVQKISIGRGMDSLWTRTGNLQDCLQILVPGMNVPDFPDWNDSCENNTGQPGGMPEQEVPGTAPDTAPDINVPQQPDDPEANLPEETPETNQPENNPGTDTPEDNGSGTDSAESKEAAQVADLVNAERAKQGLPALQYDAALGKAAQVRAKEIETFFSHTRPDGSSFVTALKEQGVAYKGAGENIAWGQKSPEHVMNAWMNSDGHRANILEAKYTRIGVGYYVNGNGVKHWVQLFAY